MTFTRGLHFTPSLSKRKFQGRIFSIFMDVRFTRCPFKQRGKRRHKRRNSVTGTRTRVAWVKARYPNHLDYYGIAHETLKRQFLCYLYLEQPPSRRKMQHERCLLQTPERSRNCPKNERESLRGRCYLRLIQKTTSEIHERFEDPFKNFKERLELLKEFAVRNELVWEIIIIRLQVCSASYGVSFWQLCWCFFLQSNCAPFVLQLLFTVF